MYTPNHPEQPLNAHQNHALARPCQMLLMFTTLMLTGCANISDDARRTKTEGVLAGCAAGAVIGTALGDNRKSALTGCAAGSVAGYAVGHHVAGKKQAYANEEAYLRDVLRQAEQQNRAMTELNQQLLEDLEHLQREELRLASAYQSARAQQLAATQMRDHTGVRLQQTRRAIAQTDQELQIQRQVLAQEQRTAPGFYLASAPGLINQLEHQKTRLQAAEDQLQRLQASVSNRP